MLRWTLLAALVALSSACATITRGTTEAWTVESEPAGAEVVLSSGETCITPCTLKKKRKHAFEVTVTKPGFEPVITSVLSQIAKAGAAGMAGNIIFGGIIGVGVDAGSGATKELKPNPLVLKLVPADVATDPDAIDPQPVTEQPATPATE